MCVCILYLAQLMCVFYSISCPHTLDFYGLFNIGPPRSLGANFSRPSTVSVLFNNDLLRTCQSASRSTTKQFRALGEVIKSLSSSLIKKYFSVLLNLQRRTFLHDTLLPFAFSCDVNLEHNIICWPNYLLRLLSSCLPRLASRSSFVLRATFRQWLVQR